MSNFTTFENKCAILAELWTECRFDVQFEDFISSHELAFPLAYAIADGMIAPTTRVEELINETFRLLLEITEQDDQGFENLLGLFTAIGDPELLQFL